MVSMTIYRDGIRDLTLLSKGFDVWQRVVATNWSVVILFLILFVAGVGAVIWLASVAGRAKKTMESMEEPMSGQPLEAVEDGHTRHGFLVAAGLAGAGYAAALGYPVCRYLASPIECACHGGVYDPRSGTNVSGPPPKPLKKYAVKMAPDGVIVSRA